MSGAKDLGPLDWRIAITANGKPTPEFQRRWNTQRDNNTLIGVQLGSGAPPVDPIPLDGQAYADTSGTPWVLYVAKDGTWHKVGVYKFTDLSDVPHSYSGAGLSLVRVNTGATALEFEGISGVLDGLGSAEGDILYRGPTTWVVLSPGTSGNFLKTQGAGAVPVWAAVPAGVSGANPTATASDAAVNGSASTFMRSDAAPAIQKASASVFGLVKVDGVTVTASSGVISAAPGVSGANPTATASDTAVNGVATTFMRSDAAPAVQKGSSSVFGVVKVDNTTITASGGVISSVGGATGANPTATAADTAVNGSAATFMRSDGAPAIQIGSSSQFGLLKVDGFTITSAAGIISSGPGGRDNFARAVVAQFAGGI